jgi:glutamyl-tRNA reductase
MELLVLGLNHRTAAVSVRERVAVPGDELPGVLEALHAAPVIREVMLLSTCNRMEVVCVPRGTDRRDAVERTLEGFLAARGEVSREALGPALYRHWGRDAALHLMRTAASLDSLVVGEPQILGQVKDAFEAACAAGTVGSTLHLVLQRVFAVAKRVRTESGIGRSAVSVGSMAAELAQSIFGDLRKSDVALVGAGEMAEQAADKLQSAGARSVTVLNRSLERAERLADTKGWRARALSDLPRFLETADVVISSTAARDHVITAAMVRGALGKRRYRPLFIVDIALPRDVAPEVGNLERVYLYNIDDLDQVIAENRERRQQEADRAEAYVREEVERFAAEIRGQRVKPVIMALRTKYLDIALAEVERTIKRLPTLGEQDQEALRRTAMAIVNKFLHEPLSALKESARGEDADRAVDWALRMFALELDPGALLGATSAEDGGELDRRASAKEDSA